MSYISAERHNDEILIWERDEQGRHLRREPAPFYFYVRDPNGEHRSMYGDKLTKLKFRNSKEFNYERSRRKARGETLFESDIPAEIKFLSEHYYGAEAPKLNITFHDIEVDYDPERGHANAEDPYAPINAIALVHTWKKKYVVLAIPPNLAKRDPNNEDWETGLASEEFKQQMDDIAELPKDIELEVRLCKDEEELLRIYLEEIQDSDVLCGWHSEIFDHPYIAKRVEGLGVEYFRKLSFPHAKPPMYRWIRKFDKEEEIVDFGGRIGADYMELFKKYEMAERPSYKLESIADEMLPHLPKLEYEGSLATLYRKNFPWFVRYNIRDTEILEGLEDRLGYMELANQMMHLSTAVWKNVVGTLKLAEYAVVNYCHNELNGLIVNDMSPPQETHKIQGAFVLTPQTGLQEGIAAIDINSLYPSSIRAINISPETLMGQFLDNTYAIDQIAKNSDVVLACKFDDATQVPPQLRGKTHRFKACDWRKQFQKMGWSVSGYGTVFSQTQQGVVPKILEDWYATRKKYQKLKAEATDKLKKAYYDKLQYTYKIKLNAFYGALTNKFFRFFDLRMGESTTGTGRMILLHQCAKTCEIMDGEYAQPDIYTTEEKKNKYGIMETREHYGYSDKWAVVYGDSVAGNTMIETPLGEMRIEDLFTNVHYRKGDKEYCNVDEDALTFVPEKGDNEFRPIKYVMRHKVNKKMYRVWLGNTRYLDVTEDHSLIGYANTKSTNTGLVEVKPTEVGSNNVNSLLLNAHTPTGGIKMEFRDIPKEMYMLIGLIIGDGHVEKRKEGGVGLSIGSQDKEAIIQEVIHPLIQQGWFTSFHEKSNGHDIRICGVRGWKFLQEALYRTGKKDFPSWVERISPENIRFVLRGYFSADGSVTGNTVRLTSVRSSFIRKANRLLKLCGIGSNFWTETNVNTYDGKPSGTFSKQLVVYDAVKFKELVGFIQERKNSKVRGSYGTKTMHMREQNGYALITPTKIEEIEYNGYVYDIEVVDTHTFYANDILVHNTDSTYFRTRGRTPEECIKYGDFVGQMVNDSFEEYMRETFLCTDGFSDKIKCGREIISDRGIFVDKKMYILHVIDNEGFAADKMKVMGLRTKKTTLPKEIANKLNGFIERYLKGEDWSVIEKDIVDYKDELMEVEDVMRIGLPTGIKRVESYQADYKLDPLVHMPGHVSASVHYNKCLEDYKDHESMRIMTGMKIKIFYLKRPNGRFKTIAIPVDIEQVPEWFLRDFEVDRKAHIKRLVDKALENILKAIGKKPPTRQQLLADELLGF